MGFVNFILSFQIKRPSQCKQNDTELDAVFRFARQSLSPATGQREKEI